jgi:hypothetical protein
MPCQWLPKETEMRALVLRWFSFVVVAFVAFVASCPASAWAQAQAQAQGPRPLPMAFEPFIPTRIETLLTTPT